MKASLEALSPLSFRVWFEVEAPDLEALQGQLADLQLALHEAGYWPTGEPPRTPDGLPICRKHQAPMRKREKQGDEWFSHTVVLDGGTELYCKGRSGADSPGWDY